MDRLDSPDQLHQLDPLDVQGHKESPAGQLAQVRLEQQVEPVLLERLDRLVQATLALLDSPASLGSLGLPELLASQDPLGSLDSLGQLHRPGLLGQLEPDSRVQPVRLALLDRLDQPESLGLRGLLDRRVSLDLRELDLRDPLHKLDPPGSLGRLDSLGSLGSQASLVQLVDILGGLASRGSQASLDSLVSLGLPDSLDLLVLLDSLGSLGSQDPLDKLASLDSLDLRGLSRLRTGRQLTI